MTLQRTPKIHDHFSRVASAYAARRPAYPQTLLDYLSTLASSAASVWDVGCGNGQLSVLLGECFAHVFATDASAEQIANAKPHPRVRYTQAPSHAAGLAAHSVDLITVAQAVHWFDLEAFYAEVRRVAKPGATIVLIAYPHCRIDSAMDAITQPFYGSIEGYWPPERRLVDEGYRTLSFPFEEMAAPSLEMQAHWSVSDFLGYLDTWSAIRGLEKAGKRDIFEKFSNQLKDKWKDGNLRTVTWPIVMRIGKVG